MNRIHRVWLLVILTTVLAGTATAAPPASLVLPDLHALEARASDSAEVTLDAHLLGLAARLLDPARPEEARARQAVTGLKSIVVRSYSFDADLSPADRDLEPIRRQLETPAWNRIVSNRSRRDATRTDIYLSVDGAAAKGLVVLTSAPREVTIISIEGAIDLDKLRRLEGQLGIPKLDLDGNARPGTH
jgi:hypothetical protein